MATVSPFKKIYLSQVDSEMPKNKPIVFWDTCSLIYIISIAVRESFSDFQSYKDIHEWIESGEIVSVTSSIVWDEFNQHYTEERGKAESDIDRLRDLIRNYAALHPEPMRSQLLSLADDIELLSILEDIEARIWKKTYVINEERQLADLAHYRVLHKMSPSCVKDQYKDAYIWCTFLSVAQRIREVKKLFITDNREDYCLPKKSSNPQQQITDDCDAVGAYICFHVDTLRNLVYCALHP